MWLLAPSYGFRSVVVITSAVHAEATGFLKGLITSLADHDLLQAVRVDRHKFPPSRSDRFALQTLQFFV